MNQRCRLYIPYSTFIKEPFDVYHAKAKVHLTSHQLIDFIRCPLLYHYKKDGLIKDKDTNAYLFGKAAHTFILEGGDAFKERYLIGGPINPATGKPYGASTKKFAEWKAKYNKEIISLEQMEAITRMADGIMSHEQASKLLDEGLSEAVLRAKYKEIDSQIRIDWLNPTEGIVDLKTCDDLNYFEADARRYRYHNQLAFYQSVLNEAIDEYVPVYIIAIEKKEPFRSGLWRLSENCLTAARRENEAAIERLKFCLSNDIWPTGYEGIRYLDIV